VTTKNRIAELPTLYNASQAAERLTLKRTAFYELVRTGEIGSVLIGPGRGALRFTEAHLAEYINRRIRENGGQP
jgi:excisionase family DNA binding protein